MNNTFTAHSTKCYNIYAHHKQRGWNINIDKKQNNHICLYTPHNLIFQQLWFYLFWTFDLETMINCFFNILPLVLTVMDVVLSATRRPQFGTKFQTIIRSAPSVMSFRKTFKNILFWTSFETAWWSCHVLSGSLLGFDTARYVDIDFD